jgi:putative ABC transport system ATP-binding protein
MTDSPFIVCDNLVKIFKIAELEVVALQGLDLVVKQGELVGIVGASGSGKSTLMNILGGLTRPSAGRVWINGKDLLKMSDTDLDHFRQFNVGFVWQQGSRNLVPYLSAVENVMLPMTLAGRTGRAKKKRAENLLDIMGLGERKRHHLSELSGGEQQRVAIAVALANEPKFILADEPTGEVDTATAAVIYKIFRDLNQQMGITIMIVSHDQTIARHVDRVVAIRDGRLATETVRQNNNSEDKEIQGTETFEELTVLDSAGRLQIPKEFREKYQMKFRVRLEATDQGVLVLPVINMEHIQSSESLVAELAQVQKHKGLRGLFNRLKKKK